MGKMQAQIDYPKGVTFEQVWATMDRAAKWQEETALRFKESQKETDRLKESQQETARLIKESRKETDRFIKELQQETAQQIKEINKRFGDYSNSFGEVVEYMIAPNLQEKFYDLGLDFQVVSRDYKVRDHKNNIYFQIDVFLQNGDFAMLVEIKTKLTVSYINEHINRLEKMRVYANLRGDKRTFLGAVAGVVVPDEVKEYALSNGFYLIEPSGENFNITAPHNKHKEW